MHKSPTFRKKGPGRESTGGRRAPAGAKMLRAFYRNKFGVKEPYAKAQEWYAFQHEAAVRVGDKP